MLDTVAITLDHDNFVVLEPERFSPSARGLLAPPFYPLGARGSFGCTLNPTPAERREGSYAPRLTLTRRKNRGGFATTLRVEFSAPKLLFGNNFDELRSQDFEAVLAALSRWLDSVRVLVKDHALRAARVSAVHYGKNIVLEEFASCSMLLAELGRIDLTRRLDLAKTDFRNEGHAVRCHANRFELAFYDKIKDLEQARISEKRAIERDNEGQVGLLALATRKARAQVLRMELRLGTRAKIMATLRDVGHQAEPTFAALFDSSVARKVLMHFWAKVRRDLPLVSVAAARRPEDVVRTLATAAPNAGPAKLLRNLGAALLVGSVGWRGAAAVLASQGSGRTWQRLRRELKALPLEGGARFSTTAAVDAALDRFERLRKEAVFGGAPSATVAVVHAKGPGV